MSATSFTETASNGIPWERGPAAVKAFLLQDHTPKVALSILNRLKPRLKDPQKIKVTAKTIDLLAGSNEKRQLSGDNHLSVMKRLVGSGALPKSPKPELARVMGLKKDKYFPGSQSEREKKIAVLLAYKGWKRFSRKHPIAGSLIKKGFLAGLLLGGFFLVSALLKFSLSLGWLSGFWPFGAAKKSVETALDAVSGAAPTGTDTIDVEMTFTNPRIE